MGLIITYLLIVAQFHSYLVTLIIMAPIPLALIYPKEGRAVRDLPHKRGQLVQMRTTNFLSVQTLVARNTVSAAKHPLYRSD